LNPFVLEYTLSLLHPALLELRLHSFALGRLRFHSKHLTKLNSRSIRFSKIYAHSPAIIAESSDSRRASKGFRYPSLPSSILLGTNQDYIFKKDQQPCWRIRNLRMRQELVLLEAFDRPVRNRVCWLPRSLPFC